MKQLIALSTITGLFIGALGRADESDWLIIPGQRIGRIFIGMEHAEVLRRLGPPHRQDDLEYLPDGEQNKEFKDTLRDDWITPLPISKHPESGEGVFMVNFVTVYVRN